MIEPRVTGIAQCPNCAHIKPLYTMRSGKHFVRCFRCEAPKKPDKDPDARKPKTKEVPRVRMRVKWLDTAMPQSLWKAYFKDCQLL